MALLSVLMTACARPTLAPSPATEPAHFPQFSAAATFPAPPQPTADVALVLPAPLPTPGGPARAYPSLNAITDLAFAPDGALWAATYEGLVRWDLTDGSYRHVGQADGLPAPGVLALAFAADGSLWAGTQSGVAYYDGATWRNYQLATGRAGDLVYDVAVAVDGTVWAGTGQGASALAVNESIGEDQGWQHYTPADGLAGSLVWQVAPAADGTVWFSTHGGGVCRLDPSSGGWTTYTAPDAFPLPNARVLAIGPDGHPWVHIGYDNVYRFDGQQWQLAYPAGGGQWVCDMAFAADGTPWIATCGGYHAYGGGLLYQDGDQWRPITTADGLVSNDLTALALRTDGVIAVGSRQGIGVYQDGRWRTLRAGPTLSPVTGAAVTPDGVAWFAFGDDHWQAAGGGLAAYAAETPANDGGQWRYITSSNGLPVSDNVRALAVAPDGNLWVGGGCGLGRLQEDQWEAVVTCDQVDGNVVHLAFAPDGAAWFATEWSVFRIATNGELAHYEHQLPLALAADAEGGAWVSHNPALGGGWMSILDPAGAAGDLQSSHPISDTLGVGPVTSMVATADGGVWVGSAQGVARLAGPGDPRLYTVVDGLPEEGVIDLAVASDGTLWAASPSAVARFDGETWWTYEPGVPDAQIQAIAPGIGKVWLAGKRGVYSLSVP